MTSIKVKFRPSKIPGQTGVIFYQIIKDRKVRHLNTLYRIYEEEWDNARSMVVLTDVEQRSSILLSIKERIRWDLERLNKIVRKNEETCNGYTIDDLIEEFCNYMKECSLFNYLESCIARLKQNGKIRTSETYKAALNSFQKFRNDEDIMLDNLTSEVMEAYEAWQRNRGVSYNTISFYTRILRAVYNRAVEQEVIENHNPFKHVYTGVDKTVKRALPLRIIKKIKGMDLSLTPSLDYARDMFIMSFYLRGMSFIDMSYLRKTDLKDGYIVYRRRKTGQKLFIKWEKEMQQILDKYPENESRYLLPIIREENLNERWIYRNMAYKVNQNLNKIAKILQINVRLTMYVARHSWASVAKSKGIPVSVISEGMGHDSETTTLIYLASLDTCVVDRANSLIISSL